MSKIIISGAGYAGLLSAIALWRQGNDVVLVGPKPKSFNRTFSLLHGTVCALESLLGTHCPNIGFKINELELNHSTRWGALLVKSCDFQLPFLFGSIAENTLLDRLIEVIDKNTTISWHESLVESISPSEMTVLTSDQKIINYDIIVACDGANSSVRNISNFQPIQIDPFTKTSMQIATVPSSTSRAYQSFSSNMVSAQIPLSNEQIAFYLTTYEPEPHPWNEKNNLLTHIKEKLDNEPSALSKLIQFRSPNHLYPSLKENVILMGEAAVSQGPVGAQGINGIITDLGVLLSHQSLLDAANKLTGIRTKRYRLNQLTQYSSLMHFGILLQGLFKPISKVVLSNMFFAGNKTSLHTGVHSWER